jgi:competence ComEA-like helix-hairpin-helix protein
MMNAMKKLSQSIGFTPSERRVALFLVATFFLGIGIRVYRGFADPTPTFDYAAMDAEFASHGPPADSPKHTAAHAAAEKGGGGRSRKKEVPPGSLNINTARKEQLMTLPGVGETTAERILEYRREHGPFTSLDDLLNVKGIGKKKLERIAPCCTIGK